MRAVPGMNRFRAQKIVQARQEKDLLIKQAAGRGVPMSELRKMKPKELRGLIHATDGG
jgi:hypothetical protein